MLFSFHQEARFASLSPDYDIFSQHSRHGFAYFNVNVSICANTHLWVWARAHSQFCGSYFCWEKPVGAEAIRALVPLWISCVPLAPFRSKTSSGICYQVKSLGRCFKLERKDIKWPGGDSGDRTWRGQRRAGEKSFKIALPKKKVLSPVFSINMFLHAGTSFEFISESCSWAVQV